MKYLIVLSVVLLGCGRGVDTICGIPYVQTAQGPEVAAGSVAVLPGASYAVISTSAVLLEQGGFAAADDTTCQFGVKNGIVYR